MNATTGNIHPAAMRASDADRDAVISDLSEHFQAGRLTAGELDERTGQALTARTWGELTELLADLPASRPGPRASAGTSSSARPRPPSARVAPPLTAALAAIGIAAVLVIVAHGWGLIWLLLPVLLMARRLTCYPGAAKRRGQLSAPSGADRSRDLPVGRILARAYFLSRTGISAEGSRTHDRADGE
jgi:Domain of unknown function (DUF1707)